MADTDTAPDVTPLAGVTVTARRAPSKVSLEETTGITDDMLRTLQKQSQSGYDTTMQRIGQIGQDYDSQIQSQLKSETGAEKSLRDTMAQAPKPELPPMTPDLQAKQLSGKAVIGTIVAGLLMGRAMKTGPFLTAAGAVNEAYKSFAANDQRRIDSAMKNWEVQSKAVEQYNTATRQQYEDILDLAKTNVTLAQSQLKFLQQQRFDAISEQYDKLGSLQAQIKTIGELQESREKSAAELEKARIQVHGQNLEHQDRVDQHKIERERNAIEAAKVSAQQGPIDNENLKEWFGLDKALGLNAKDASRLATSVDGVRAMDMIERSLKDDPDLNRKVSLLIAQTNGNLDNYLKLTESDQDNKVQAFNKELIELTRQGALVLAGDRGLTVGGERIANQRILQGATSPGGIAAMAHGFAEDIKRKVPQQVNGQRLDWAKVPPLPLFGTDETPLVGPGAGGAAAPAPVKVTTPAEAAKLAPGTLYETPDGRQFTR